MNNKVFKVRHTPEQRRTIFKNFRKEIGCTQKEMSDYMATPARTIERWETRSAPPEALIQMIIIKNELHDAIRERSEKIKKLEEIINEMIEENTRLALQLEDLQYYTKTLEGQVRELGGDPEESKPISEEELNITKEEELNIMKEVAEERCYGAEIKNLM